MSEKNAKRILTYLLPVLIALFSIVVMANIAAKSSYSKEVIESLDENRNTVLKLTASATAVSVAISMLPDDTATPVANKLTSLTTGFLIILTAIYFEKFIMTISGAIAFKWMIPFACALFMLGKGLKRQTFLVLSKKVAILAMAILLVVPLSIELSNDIKESFNDTINETIESAENSSKEIKETSSTESSDSSGFGKILDTLKKVGDSIANGVSDLTGYLEKLLGRFIDAIAVMIVTTCIMPILVVLIFYWLIKYLFSVDMSVTMKDAVSQAINVIEDTKAKALPDKKGKENE